MSILERLVHSVYCGSSGVEKHRIAIVEHQYATGIQELSHGHALRGVRGAAGFRRLRDRGIGFVRHNETGTGYGVVRGVGEVRNQEELRYPLVPDPLVCGEADPYPPCLVGRCPKSVDLLVKPLRESACKLLGLRISARSTCFLAQPP